MGLRPVDRSPRFQMDDEVAVTYETIRQWCQRFGPVYAQRLRRRRGRMGDTWHLDEVFVTIQGRQQYLWRSVDGDALDILVQSHRNRRAAGRFFRTLPKTQGRIPRRLITDELRSYAAACRTVMPSGEQYRCSSWSRPTASATTFISRSDAPAIRTTLAPAARRCTELPRPRIVR